MNDFEKLIQVSFPTSTLISAGNAEVNSVKAGFVSASSVKLMKKRRTFKMIYAL